MASIILLCAAVIVTGAAMGNKAGWVVLALGVLALLSQIPETLEIIRYLIPIGSL